MVDLICDFQDSILALSREVVLMDWDFYNWEKRWARTHDRRYSKIFMGHDWPEKRARKSTNKTSSKMIFIKSNVSAHEENRDTQSHFIGPIPVKQIWKTRGPHGLALSLWKITNGYIRNIIGLLILLHIISTEDKYFCSEANISCTLTNTISHLNAFF